MESDSNNNIVFTSCVTFQMFVKINGSFSKQFTEVSVGKSNMNDYETFLTSLCNAFQLRTNKDCIIYSLFGIRIDNEDVQFVQDQDFLYLETKAKPFDTRQIIDQYVIDKLLGEGGFGKVWRGKHKRTGQFVAIKYIDLQENLKQANKIEQIYKEAKVLMGLQHRNIIRLYSTFVVNTDICLIMEYADGGELVDFVRDKDGLSELEARNIVKQVTLAMQLCHSKGIVHRDLKLENVMFES